ncbi:MAG: hypothetical protein QNK19_09665 [Xanthomonadales bacterium]|nr:hypothetical protein [Xanthomonadales bacterium]
MQKWVNIGCKSTASQTPGAVTVESVDLRDLVSFARNLDIDAPGALLTIAEFAKKLMTNVGPPQLLRRVESLTRGTARTEPTTVECAALNFENDRTYGNLVNLLVELNKQTGTRVYRPAVLRSCIRALQICVGSEDMNFYDATVQVREQNRFQGRSLPRRAVGSTLLLKGLEAEVAVILNADRLNASNLYVAMTRGSKRLIICSRNSALNPE